jgi:CheY-like chemotaxis protein
VDDEAPNRTLLSRWLEGWGYAVKQAASATEALERMLAEPASIILVDIAMPGHDGFWLVERIRQKWPKTAIIMATGADDMDGVMKSQRAGAVDYLLKPFGRELLRQALDRAEVTLRE